MFGLNLFGKGPGGREAGTETCTFLEALSVKAPCIVKRLTCVGKLPVRCPGPGIIDRQIPDGVPGMARVGIEADINCN